MRRLQPSDLLLFAFLVTVGACGGPGGATSHAGTVRASTPGWTVHRLTAGLLVETPANWRPDAQAATGQVVLHGPAGEQVLIWPMTLAQADLSPTAAAVLLTELARTAAPQLAWTASPASTPGIVRVTARGREREGVSMLMWRPAPRGVAACVFVLHTPTGRYPSAAETFGTIVASVRQAAGPNAPAAAGAPRAPQAPAAPQFVTWSDPRESAFSASVPAGWRVAGGAYRLSATDIRQTLTVLSPDGAVRATLGDANIGAFTIPTQMHAMTGLREGAMTSLGDGTMIQILRFVPGEAFVREYVQRYMAPICGGSLRVVSGRDRPDLAMTFLAQARAEGIMNPHLTAGEASFACTLNGREAVGSYVAATMVPLPNTGPMWYVYRLYGYIAPPDRQQDGMRICEAMVSSFTVNPAWREKERQIAAAAVYQDNLRSQQIRSRALQAIAEDLRQTSEIVSSSYWQRQQVYDEISRRRENGILGTVDVVDPATGRQFKVGYNADHHWMDGQGNIVGTLTHTSPGLGWREMIELK